MKHECLTSCKAFTFWELLGVIGALSVLTTLLFAYPTHPGRTGHPIRCTQNLKEIQVASLMFSSDHDQNLPFSATNCPAYQNTTDAWRHFLALSNELGNPRVLICPQDIERKSAIASTFTPATNSAAPSLLTLQNQAVSYFIDLDSHYAKPDMVFIGDRNVYLPGQHITNSLLTTSGTNLLQWTAGLHTNRGNILRADGRLETQVDAAQAWPDHADSIRLLLP